MCVSLDVEDEKVVFYDAVEDVDELSENEDAENGAKIDGELKKLKDERIKINQHQAKIRAKKVDMIYMILLY